MRKVGIAIAALAIASMVLATSAQAQVTVGQVAPSGAPPVICTSGTSFDELQTATAAGTSYVVPLAGVLTSWSTAARSASGQQLGFKVFRPAGPGKYTVVGADGPRALSSGVLNTFPISIAVQAGDVIGINVQPASLTTASECWFETANAGDRIGWQEGTVGPGGSITLEAEGTESRLNVSATLLPPPTVSGIAPAEGSIAGGTSVLVAGSNFASVTGVSFGSTPAASFTVGNEGQITAVAPASTTVTSVPITVTTAAGTATSTQTFAYKGCVVPKLSHKSLKAAKKRARKASCKIGKVKLRGDVTPKTGRVVKQKPKPGAVLIPGSKVNVTLG